MTIYSVDVKICGTAYIKADSPEQAQKKLDELYQSGFEVAPDTYVCDLPFNHPDLGEFTLSPAMTLYGRFGDDTPMEEAE